MWTELKGEGLQVQFVVLSDSNASWFITSPPTPPLTMPVFRDPSANRSAWRELDSAAVKHDTVVFDAMGQKAFVWRSSQRSVSAWRGDIGAAVRALPR